MKDTKSMMASFTRIHKRAVSFFSLILALAVFGIDLSMGRKVQFPLLYILPVAVAAWAGEVPLAYLISFILPMARTYFELPSHSSAAMTTAGLNALNETVALMLYTYLISKTAAKKRSLQHTVHTREQELRRLRTFAKITSTTLQGRGVSPGMAEGMARVYLPDEESSLSPSSIPREEVAAEIQHLEHSLKASIHELETTQDQFASELAAAENALLDVQLTMLKDTAFWEKSKRRVQQSLIKAEQAVEEEVRELTDMMEQSEQAAMRKRSTDIRDIARRVIRNIRSTGVHAPHPLAALAPGTILVARELFPSDTLQLDRPHLSALVLEQDSPTSHVAILARAMRIPMICDVQDATVLLATGDRLLVDAEAGSVIVAPTPAQAARFSRRRDRYVHIQGDTDAESPRDCMTSDGAAITLMANIGRTDEIHLVQDAHLAGVGLFRSEFLFLNEEEAPNAKAQAAAYSMAAQMLHPQPVTIRTVDLGGDKIPRFARDPVSLRLRSGKRGLAYTLSDRELFRTHLRAILQASASGNVRIMFPMVLGLADLQEARAFVEEIRREEQIKDPVPIGAMIETPSAVFAIHDILKIADFISIGTNDLSHFILAVDRGSPEYPGVQSFLQPCVLDATRQIILAAREQDIPLSVCGEAAGDPAAACLLAGMGVRTLSMSPLAAPRVRAAIRRFSLEQLDTVAHDALQAKTPEEIQGIIDNVFHSDNGHDRSNT